MKINTIAGAGALVGLAGMAIAQPTIDGVYDPGTEGGFYSDLIWVNDVPTAFGDNSAGLFTGGNFGNPEVVDTGIELCIPLASLGLSGSETIRIAGWVNSGDRTFKSNQIVGDLPIDTGNLGGAQDFNAAPFDGTTQHISVDLSAAATGPVTVDGVLDGGVGGSAYSNAFLQGNYTGFGDETDGTADGSGPNGGGSEIDGIYVSKDATNLYIFVAGNLEGNGNAVDLYIDTGAGGSSTLGLGSGAGAFIVDGQSGLVFDAGFDADYVVSVDAWNDDGDDGTTPNVPRAFLGSVSGSIDDLGSLAGYGAANAGALAGGVSMAIDNSNIEGVIGDQSQATPVSPDADWAYGSELDNARVYIDEPNNKLYLFIAGNMEANYNKLMLFFDSQPGGQNVLLDSNVDISFNGLNSMSNITFDSGFEPDYWLNINNGVDGGTGNLLRFTDAATLRTNGALIDPFFGVIVDYGSFDGGETSLFPVIPFDGPRVDIQDGSLGSLFANYAPRLLQVDPMTPIGNLVNIGMNNSNVDGVTDTDASGASAVNTGIEVCIDLDELGWDGVQDILVGGWIVNGGFDFLSNQVLGGIPGPDNIGPRDADGDGVNDLDFNTIAGDQFLNLTNPDVVVDCPADLTGDGVLNFFDVSAFLQAFGAQDPIADFTNDGIYNFFDVSAFLGAFAAGCP
ncbi:MAG: GC-type dockerin domain-anchored protein [Phycisphaerales bacterium]